MTISARPITRVAAVSLIVAACAGNPHPTAASPQGTYDVVIAGGRIVDGTGNPWYYGDVGITGDRIAAVVPAGMLANAHAGKRIDAKGIRRLR